MSQINFEKAHWIWESSSPKKDEYIEIIDTFTSKKIGNTIIKISADSNYALYINDKLCDFGQYSDYTDDKYGDIVDISNYVSDGTNTLKIIVWYYGKNFSTYCTGDAGLIYEIVDNNSTVAYSSEKTLSRLSPKYVSHKALAITVQLGFTFEYDMNCKDNEYHNSIEQTTRSKSITLRPIKKTIIEDRVKSTKCFGGAFKAPETYGTAAEMMANSFLSFIVSPREENGKDYFTITSNDGDGVYFIVDLQKETVGFLDVDFEVDNECEVDIAYGEHLTDGRVRTFKRNFTCKIQAQKGRNIYLNPFRRFGCRYLQVFVHSSYVKVNYVGLRPVTYPLSINTIKTTSKLQREIVDTCIRTLQLCMHEHYEDCPWREQALYAMDSRNQALCGYYAFGEYDFPRASIRLLGSKLRSDGTMKLCAPMGDDLTIPSFNLVFYIMIAEYIKYSKDTSIAVELFDNLETVMSVFLSKMQPNGLISNLYGKKEDGYWGFFEWSDTLDGIFGETEKYTECPLNAFLSLALQSYSEICSSIEKDNLAKKYSELALDINKNIQKEFYNKNTKLFETFLEKHQGKYSVLNNALCVLCGAADNVDCSKINEILISNGKDTNDIIPCTLSMFIYRFDAMIKIDSQNKYAIISEIEDCYDYMLKKGATTFWETMKGEEDVDHVGSLCHGWSALPIYYFSIL
ncbi:MAG: hypothetical protein MJ236_05800 [Clostridia bacterium]|nr:hypothetical protein [Clostridia bacterium]